MHPFSHFQAFQQAKIKTRKQSNTKSVSRKDMSAAVIIFLLILIGLGVAYQMGILEPYIKEAQARMKQGSGGGPSQ
ncbi:hypothetical protein X798_03567 [Onchocerca flexuosa]|nr:hypothetical protein X798_03567 [Onchocerca flexuosa]